MNRDHTTEAHGTIVLADGRTARAARMLRDGDGVARAGEVQYATASRMTAAGASTAQAWRTARAERAATFRLDPQQAAWLHEQAAAEDRARTAVAEQDDAARDAEDDKREQQLMTELVDTLDAMNRAGISRDAAAERLGRLLGVCTPTDDRSRTVVANAAVKAFANVDHTFGPHPYVAGVYAAWGRGWRAGSAVVGIVMGDPADLLGD